MWVITRPVESWLCLESICPLSLFACLLIARAPFLASSVLAVTSLLSFCLPNPLRPITVLLLSPSPAVFDQPIQPSLVITMLLLLSSDSSASPDLLLSGEESEMNGWGMHRLSPTIMPEILSIFNQVSFSYDHAFSRISEVKSAR